MFEQSYTEWCESNGRHPKAHTSKVEWNEKSHARYLEVKDIPIRSEFPNGEEGDADYKRAKRTYDESRRRVR